jgi:hypothetical protein
MAFIYISRDEGGKFLKKESLCFRHTFFTVHLYYYKVSISPRSCPPGLNKCPQLSPRPE